MLGVGRSRVVVGVAEVAVDAAGVVEGSRGVVVAAAVAAVEVAADSLVEGEPGAGAEVGVKGKANETADIESAAASMVVQTDAVLAVRMNVVSVGLLLAGRRPCPCSTLWLPFFSRYRVWSW